MKNKIIVLGLSMLAFICIESRLQAAAEPLQAEIILPEEQNNLAIAVAGAIYFKSPDGVEQLLHDNNLVEHLLLSDSPSMAAHCAINFTRAVHNELQTIFSDASLDALQNPAGIRFKQLMQNASALARFTRHPEDMWRAAREINKEIISHAHIGGVAAVFFAQNGNIISVGDKDGYIKIWDSRTKKMIERHDDARASRVEVTLSALRTTIAIKHWYDKPCQKKETISVWNVQSGEKINEFKCDLKSVICFALSPDGSLLAVGQRDKVIVWDVQTGISREINNVTAFSLAFSLDGKSLAVGSEGGVTLWNVKTLTHEKSFKRETLWGDLSFLSTGRLIAYSHYDLGSCHQAAVWLRDVQTGKVVECGNGGGIPSYALSPDGNLLALASDHEMSIWSAKLGKSIRKFNNETTKAKSINVLAFSPDNTMLITGHGDGDIIIWKVRLGDE